MLEPQAAAFGEVAFLRGEVHNLQHVIGAARRAYEEETAKQAVVVEHAERQLLELREFNSKLQDEIASLGEQVRVFHAQQVDARAAAAVQADEAAVLKSGLQLLRGELVREEQERLVARELEACALSVASTYREFAIQGAAQLESMESGVQAAGHRLEAQLANVGASTTATLRRRALRIVLGAAAAHLCEAALRRWAASVALARAAEADVVRITAAVRRETQRRAARRTDLEVQLRSERATAAEALGQAQTQIGSLQREMARMETAVAALRDGQHPAGDCAATSTCAPAASTLDSDGCDRQLEQAFKGTDARTPVGFVPQAELDAVRAERDAMRTQLSEAQTQLRRAEAARVEIEREAHFYEAALRDERRVAAEREERELLNEKRAHVLAHGNAEASAGLDRLLEAVAELRLDVVDTLLRSVRASGELQPLLR